MENRVIVRLENVSKKYGNTTVIENTDLENVCKDKVQIYNSDGKR